MAIDAIQQIFRVRKDGLVTAFKSPFDVKSVTGFCTLVQLDIVTVGFQHLRCNNPRLRLSPIVYAKVLGTRDVDAILAQCQEVLAQYNRHTDRLMDHAIFTPEMFQTLVQLKREVSDQIEAYLDIARWMEINRLTCKIVI